MRDRRIGPTSPPRFPEPFTARTTCNRPRRLSLQPGGRSTTQDSAPSRFSDGAANPDPPPFFRDVVGVPHSVVTAHLVDQDGQPTIAARDEILEFLTHRLLAGN